MEEDMGIGDALAKACIVCMVLVAIFFGGLNLWTRCVRHYQQQIGMERGKDNAPSWIHAR
jgi:hypothetical protein